MTKQFVKILNWGEAAGLKRSKHQGPAEYTAKLAILVPEKTTELANSAELFEKALYSECLLSKEEIRLFNAAVRRIVEKPSDNQKFH